MVCRLVCIAIAKEYFSFAFVRYYFVTHLLSSLLHVLCRSTCFVPKLSSSFFVQIHLFCAWNIFFFCTDPLVFVTQFSFYFCTDPLCPDTSWVSYRGACYKQNTVQQSLTFSEAEAECVKEDAHLTSILSDNEMLFIHYLLTVYSITSSSRTYIGENSYLYHNYVL